MNEQQPDANGWYSTAVMTPPDGVKVYAWAVDRHGQSMGYYDVRAIITTAKGKRMWIKDDWLHSELLLFPYWRPLFLPPVTLAQNSEGSDE
jgi:hypothetical protein